MYGTYDRKASPSELYPWKYHWFGSNCGETSSSSVITKEENGLKRGNTELNRPKSTLMNPELLYTLPPYQTACGIVDIMMHT